jgi:hypothetical protein
MKLKEIIKQIEDNVQGWSSPNFVEYAKKMLPRHFIEQDGTSSISIILNLIDHYLNREYISKNESKVWFNAINEDLQDLRKRIEELENENQELSTALEVKGFQDPGTAGISKEELELIDRMIVEEYISDYFA